MPNLNFFLESFVLAWGFGSVDSLVVNDQGTCLSAAEISWSTTEIWPRKHLAVQNTAYDL